MRGGGHRSRAAPGHSVKDVDDFDEGGRGLHILDIMACCWGGTRTPTGKVMWFELSEGDDDAA